MRFISSPLQGAWIIEAEPATDERGSMTRVFCAHEFRERGLEPRMIQSVLSKTLKRHTLRGLHWQAGVHAEAKLVQCLRGRVLDVIVDLREGSPTFGQHEKVTLDGESGRALYIPRGFAHGFLSLEDDTWVHYHMSASYHPQAARGLRWDDPRLAIAWPHQNPFVSERDRRWPDFTPAAVLADMAT